MVLDRKIWRWGAGALVFAVAIARLINAADPPPDLCVEYERLSSAISAAAPRWRPEQPTTGSLLFVASDQYASIETDGNTYRSERIEYADALFALAKEAADAGQLSLAFQWATEAARENPDHMDARRVLGYEQRNGQWLTSYGARMADAGKEWDSRRGWVSANDVAAPATKTETKWQVRTDHFLVSSNHSQDVAVELAARLERLHQVWQQLFAGFCFSEREVRKLFAGERQARQRHRPFRVFCHRHREDYVAALERRQPRIAETLGIYFDTDREAHFFPGDDQDAGTLYHEAVHQLFQETRSAARRVGSRANFWIVEGVATYFETLREHRDSAAGLYFTVGQSTAGRLPAARRRLVGDGYYVPLAQLVEWGKDDLQRQPGLAKLYSQSAGLAAFLMDGSESRYREPLVRYLQAVYAGRDDAQTLVKVSGRSFQELDAEYRQFMESLP